MPRNPVQQIRKLIQKQKELSFFRSATPEAIFTRIYNSNKWGDGESRSGKGSSLRATRRLREQLPALLRELQTETLLDIPCGDFYWMQNIELPVKHYIGADIVKPLITRNEAEYGNGQRRFLSLDLLNGALPAADTILCRECLVHLSLDDIAKALINIRTSAAKYLLTTHFPEMQTNKDIVTGKHRRLNFCAAPFNWPAPITAITEQDATARRGRKDLAVGKIADLP